MRCRQAKKLLSPYLDGELSEQEKVALEEHLQDCFACQAELESLRKLSEGLKGIYRQVKAPPDFLDRVMARIAELESQENHRPIEGKAKGGGRWRKFALAAAFAASLGLVTIQYGRAGTGSGVPTWPGPDKVAVQNTTVIAENTESASVGKKVSSREQEQGEASPGSGAVEWPSTAGGPVKTKKEVTSQAGAPGGQVEKKPGSTGSGQEPREQGKTDTRVAASQEIGSLQKVFLSKSRHVRTTMVKVEVDNLPYAKEVVAVLAEKAGAERPREVWVYQQEEAILRAVLLTGSTNQFLENVAKLGKEVDRERNGGRHSRVRPQAT